MPGAELEVGEQLPARAELLFPAPGDSWNGAGGDDPVIGGVFGPAVDAVARSQVGVSPEAGQSFCGGRDEVHIDVDGEHQVVAEAVSQ